MMFQLMAKDSALPCEVRADEDNGIYTIRKSDTSGEVFNDLLTLKNWVYQHWSENQFQNSDEFNQLLQLLENNEEEQI